MVPTQIKTGTYSHRDLFLYNITNFKKILFPNYTNPTRDTIRMEIFTPSTSSLFILFIRTATGTYNLLFISSMIFLHQNVSVYVIRIFVQDLQLIGSSSKANLMDFQLQNNRVHFCLGST